MTKENINTEITHTASAIDDTPSEATYEFVVMTFRELGTCEKHKYIGMMFEDELDEENLLQCLDLALERGDLVNPTIGCISAPEFAEKSHPDSTTWDEDEPVRRLQAALEYSRRGQEQ